MSRIKRQNHAELNFNNLWKGLALLLIPAGFLLLFFFLPLWEIFNTVIGEYFSKLIINWGKISRVFFFTTLQALASTALTIIAGLPLAWIFSRYKFAGKKFFKSLFSVPFILPTVVTAAAFSSLIGPRGTINLWLMEIYDLQQPPIQLMNTIWIILIAHVFYNISVVMRIVGNAWSAIDVRLEDAAQTLGSTPWQTFRSVTFPLLKSSIASSVLLVFLFDFTSYGVVLLLGGARYRTIEVEIAQQAMQMFNLPMAGLLSILQIIVTVGITIIENRIKNDTKSNRIPKTADENLKTPQHAWEKVAITVLLTVTSILLLSPLLSLALRSFIVFDSHSISWTSSYYQRLFINERSSFFYVPPIQALWNSLKNGFLAAVISLSIGMLIALANDRFRWTRKLNAVFMIPVGTSSVTLGLGYLLFFRSYIKHPLLIPFAHSLIGLPFVIRSLGPLFQGIPASLRQAGAMLGASPLKVFTKIDLPILRRGLINAGIFAFTISLGEFGATSFLSTPDRPTIPIAIFRFLGQPGATNYGQAMAMSTILMCFCLLGIGVLENDFA